MTRLPLAVIALCLLPSLADAQRTTRGEKEANWDNIASKSAPAGPTISGKDFEKVSPFKALMDKKKDLKLTDAQLAAFKEADAKLLADNSARFSMLDSLKKEAKPKTSGDPSVEDQTRMVLARDALNGVVRDIRVSFEAAQKEVAALDDSQKEAAMALLTKNGEKMQEMLREKMGGRGGGGPAGGGRGGRGRGGS